MAGCVAASLMAAGVIDTTTSVGGVHLEQGAVLRVGQDAWETIRLFPSGSRNQNVGGTPS